MKRLLQVLAFFIILLLIAAFVLPIVFKDDILNRAKQEINNQLTAEVNFSDLDISLFRNFPNFSVSLNDITVDGTEHFEGIRLADVEEFNLELDLLSVISGSQFQIKSIGLKNVDVHVIVDTAGIANYDIVKTSEDSSEDIDKNDESDTTTSSFKLSLQKYSLENINFIYDDKPGDMKAIIKHLNHEGTGDFTTEIVNLKTLTHIDSLTFIYDGIAYLKNTVIDADMGFEFNQTTFKISFGENELSANNLKLNFEGYIAMPDENIDMDLAFSTPQSDFKSVLSLIPTVYAQDFDKVETSGEFAFAGKAKGIYNSELETYPTFDLKFNVDNARFNYPDLPASVEKINIKTHIYNPTAKLDGIVIDVPTASLFIAESPLEAKLHLSKPISDPNFSAYLKTQLNLANIAKVVPAEGYNYTGNINADLDLAGKMSDIEAEQYDNVKVEGSLLVQNINLKSEDLPYTVSIPLADMLFSPQNVNLKAFNASIGKSDIAANGYIDNILPFVLRDELLTGTFNITSNNLNLNELSASTDEETEEEVEENTEASTSELEVIRIPQNIDFNLTANIKQLIYDNLEINNVNGKLTLKEGAIAMDNLLMELLGGSLALSGGYDSKPAAPLVNFNLKINNFTFKESFEKFVTIQKLAPIMANTEGTYSTGFNLKSELNPDMSPDLNTVFAQGSLVTKDLSTTTKALEKLASAVKNPKLSTLNIGNTNLNFKIENGKLEVEPFNIKAGNISAVVSGTSGLDESIDYTMDMKLPASGIASTDILSKIGTAQNGQIDLGVKIGGTVKNPTISTTLGDILNNAIDNIKNQVTDKVNEVKDDAIKDAKAKAAKLIADAEAQGDKLIAAAQVQADKIKSEAKQLANKVVSEANSKADKLEKEAKGNILKEKAAKVAADKLRKEGKEQSDKIQSEANKKADALVNSAKKQKESLVQQAKEKAQIENN